MLPALNYYYTINKKEDGMQFPHGNFQLQTTLHLAKLQLIFVFVDYYFFPLSV